MNAATRYALRAAAVVFGAATVIAAVRGARRGTEQWRDEGRPQQRETSAVLVVGRPRAEVYDLFRDLVRLAEALGPTVSISSISDDKFLWVESDGHATLSSSERRQASGQQPRSSPERRQAADRSPVAVTVHLTGDVPDVLIAWRTEDPPLPHEGSVRFSDSAAGAHTQIDLSLRYRWSAARAREAGIPDDAVQTRVYRYLATLGESAPLSERTESERRAGGPDRQ